MSFIHLLHHLEVSICLDTLWEYEIQCLINYTFSSTADPNFMLSLFKAAITLCLSSFCKTNRLVSSDVNGAVFTHTADSLFAQDQYSSHFIISSYHDLGLSQSLSLEYSCLNYPSLVDNYEFHSSSRVFLSANMHKAVLKFLVWCFFEFSLFFLSFKLMEAIFLFKVYSLIVSTIPYTKSPLLFILCVHIQDLCSFCL